MPLTSMRITAEQAKEYKGLMESADNGRTCYPYGLCLTLGPETLKKLGITALPQVGTKFTLAALGEVVGTCSYPREGGEQEMHVELQITDIGVETPVHDVQG